MKHIDYQKPTMRVVKLQHSGFICQSGSKVSSVKGGIFSGVSSDDGTGTARSRGFDDWDDE